MAKFLIRANYVGEGIKGLLTEGGTSRRETVEKLIASMGGSMESFYYALGETDVYVTRYARQCQHGGCGD